MNKTLCFGLVIISVGTWTGSSAEQSQVSTAAAGDALQEIVVTAQRREENLQHAAVAVTALT
ncbi:MAG: hypothetical protein ABJD53_08150, partial [Gammaproteobacteria bacterium]